MLGATTLPAAGEPDMYRATTPEVMFMLEHVIGAGRLAETAAFAEAGL